MLCCVVWLAVSFSVGVWLLTGRVRVQMCGGTYHRPAIAVCRAGGGARSGSPTALVRATFEGLMVSVWAGCKVVRHAVFRLCRVMLGYDGDDGGGGGGVWSRRLGAKGGSACVGVVLLPCLLVCEAHARCARWAGGLIG